MRENRSSTSPNPRHEPCCNARCRGQARILTDVLTRAGALNLARLATLGLGHSPAGWIIA